MSLSHICRVPWEAKRDLQSLELELQGVERFLMCVLATKLSYVSSTTVLKPSHTKQKTQILKWEQCLPFHPIQ